MFPKCFPYWNYNNKKVINRLGKGVAYSGKGFLLPCCWCDNYLQENDFEKLGFFETSLKLENVKDIENEVLLSDTWKNFRKILIENDSAEIPKICKEKCSKIPYER